jgi:DNA-binding beta-propeller fold protein YncE
MRKKVNCLILLLILCTWIGCASAPKRKEAIVFFPPAPELPRIQYLTSFAGLKDVEGQSSFNKFVAGEKQNLKLNKPYGAAIYDGNIYVCDTNNTVVIFDLKKKEFRYLLAATQGQGKLREPLNISIEPDGTKYVTDPERGQIVVFDRNDEYVRAYGEPGKWRPVDAVPFQDHLYVADIEAGNIKVFNKASGEIVRTIGDKGERSERLDRPTNLAFDPKGYLYVTDISRFQVVKFDRDGHFKTAFGKPGDNLGHFARPKGLAIDREGQIYVVDAAFNNVQVFNKDGRLLLFFGTGGTEPGQFVLPAKVVIDYDNVKYFQNLAQPNFKVEYLLLVTSQLEKRSITVLAYGKEKGKKYPTDEDLKKLMEEKKQKANEKQQKS